MPEFLLYYIVAWYIFGAIEFPHQAIKGIMFARKVVQKAREPFTPKPLNYVHVIVLPNYSEPLSLLCDTLSELSSHSNAKESYIIALAMEDAEEGGLQKGHKIKAMYQTRFRDVIVTSHPKDVPGESRGKASNVNFAVRCLSQLLTDTSGDKIVFGGVEMVRRGPALNASQIVLTIADADSQIPEKYFQEVDIARTKDSEYTPYGYYEPPMWFARNLGAVPALVRAADSIWSMLVMTNLNNRRGIIFPCSTYSVTLNLIRDAGFWDTDAESIAEDMHCFIKCFCNTNGRARGTPIYVPIFLTNIETEGYFENIKARATQGIRHMSGLADVGYVLSWLFGLSRRDTAVSPPESKGNGLTEIDSAVDVQMQSGHSSATLNSSSSDESLGGSIRGPRRRPKKSLTSQQRSRSHQTDKASISDLVLFVLYVLEPYIINSVSWGLCFSLWVGPLVNPAFPHIPDLFQRAVLLNASTVMSQVCLVITFEWMHYSLGKKYPKTEKRRWFHIFDWLLLPFALLFFFTIALTISSWRMIWSCIRGRQHSVEYVVASKGSLGKPVYNQPAAEPKAVLPNTKHRLRKRK